jgi:alanine racemase
MKADLQMGLPKRCYALVDLDALLMNLQALSDCLEDECQVIAIIKANAYGHGSISIAALLEQEERVWGFGVATAEEALALRTGGIGKPILILGYTFPDTYELLAMQEIRPVLFRKDQIPQLIMAARRTGKQIKVHVKVDTGMNRIGIAPNQEGLELCKELSEAEGLLAEGIFTHFTRADEQNMCHTTAQLAAFNRFVEEAERTTGLVFNIKHCANSAGILRMSGTNMDAVRAGISLYGLYPSEGNGIFSSRLHPVLSLHSQIIYVKQIHSGQSVGYGGTFTARSEMRIATIPMGYGDGYPRSLSGKGYVLICGKRAPILGRVCMDQFMVDITQIPQAAEGSHVTLLGRDLEESITVMELSRISGRFHYELLCCLGDRIPRVYQLHGKLKSSPD